MRILALAGILLASCAAHAALQDGAPVYQNVLRPFTTDGCSDFPNGIPLTNDRAWLSCCVQHDVLYWAGGTSAERLAADKFLRGCVAKAGHPEIGELMYLGVRKGGDAALPTSFAWGYGWAMNRGYAALNAAEKAQVETEKQKLPEDLSTLPIEKESNLRAADHLTNDRCFDLAVVEIERTLGRPFSIEAKDSKTQFMRVAFHRSMEIQPVGCGSPFRFDFLLSQKDGCTKLAADEFQERARVQLTRTQAPTDCAN